MRLGIIINRVYLQLPDFLEQLWWLRVQLLAETFSFFLHSI